MQTQQPLVLIRNYFRERHASPIVMMTIDNNFTETHHEAQPKKETNMVIAIAVVAGLLWSATVGFEAGQASPDTKNIFTSVAEKNQ
jgi:hypothetical protein